MSWLWTDSPAFQRACSSGEMLLASEWTAGLSTLALTFADEDCRQAQRRAASNAINVQLTNAGRAVAIPPFVCIRTVDDSNNQIISEPPVASEVQEVAKGY